jgi:hypothetical protein
MPVEAEQVNKLRDYRTLMNELTLLRECEGGTLPEVVESAYVSQLDALWWELSESEQAEYEANPETLTGPETLGLVDCEVAMGSTKAPRSPQS